MITKFVLIMNLFWWYLDYLINSFLQLWWMSSLNWFKRKSQCLVGEIIRRMKNFGEKSEEKMKVEGVWLGWKIGKKMVEYMSFLPGLLKINLTKLERKWEWLLICLRLFIYFFTLNYNVFYLLFFCHFILSFSFIPATVPHSHQFVACFIFFFSYLFSIKSVLFFLLFYNFFNKYNSKEK